VGNFELSLPGFDILSTSIRSLILRGQQATFTGTSNRGAFRADVVAARPNDAHLSSLNVTLLSTGKSVTVPLRPGAVQAYNTW
jgi:hypothetical protein